MKKWPILFKCARNMLPPHVGNSEKCVGNIHATILQNANVLEEMEHMVEYSCMCRKKRNCIKKGRNSSYTCRKHSSRTSANV